MLTFLLDSPLGHSGSSSPTGHYSDKPYTASPNKPSTGTTSPNRPGSRFTGRDVARGDISVQISKASDPDDGHKLSTSGHIHDSSSDLLVRSSSRESGLHSKIRRFSKSLGGKTSATKRDSVPHDLNAMSTDDPSLLKLSKSLDPPTFTREKFNRAQSEHQSLLPISRLRDSTGGSLSSSSHSQRERDRGSRDASPNSKVPRLNLPTAPALSVSKSSDSQCVSTVRFQAFAQSALLEKSRSGSAGSDGQKILRSSGSGGGNAQRMCAANLDLINTMFQVERKAAVQRNILQSSFKREMKDIAFTFQSQLDSLIEKYSQLFKIEESKNNKLYNELLLSNQNLHKLSTTLFVETSSSGTPDEKLNVVVGFKPKKPSKRLTSSDSWMYGDKLEGIGRPFQGRSSLAPIEEISSPKGEPSMPMVLTQVFRKEQLKLLKQQVEECHSLMKMGIEGKHHPFPPSF